MRIITWIIIILVVALLLKSNYPDIYEQSFGKGIDYGMTLWNAKKGDIIKSGDRILGNGTIETVPEGTLFGQPFDEVNYACRYDANCKGFSVYAICNTETGNCVQGPTR